MVPHVFGRVEIGGVAGEPFDGKAAGGEAILGAQTALYEELVHFFRGLGRNDLAKAVEAQRRVIDLPLTFPFRCPCTS
jgi:hypothetical protein